MYEAGNKSSVPRSWLWYPRYASQRDGPSGSRHRCSLIQNEGPKTHRPMTSTKNCPPHDQRSTETPSDWMPSSAATSSP